MLQRVYGACGKRRYGCSRGSKVEYSAKRTQTLADEGLFAFRRGVDETEEPMAWRLGRLGPTWRGASRPSKLPWMGQSRESRGRPSTAGLMRATAA